MQRHFETRPGRSAERGLALMSVVVAIVLLASMAALMMRTELASQHEVEANRSGARTLYLAEAAISEGLNQIATAQAASQAPAAAVGSSGTPLELHGGEYWAALSPNVDGSFTIEGRGRHNSVERAIEVVAAPAQGGIFQHAIFAGNSSGDPAYTLEVGGLGEQADLITGDVFSAGDVLVQGDATIGGEIRAGGDIYGATGTEGVSQPLPDIAGMNYATTSDVNVAALFQGATWKSNSLGGSAYQLPESSPAHIFRKNPSDRSDETSSTKKNDYFLEDPYESVSTSSDMSGKYATSITLSGQAGNPGVDGSDLVYYIDGNLWVHNNKIFSFKFTHQSDETARVTFVVSGNVYFSDNVFLQNLDEDGVAFIAIKDAQEADSGNIYFGDPEFGTLETMNAFMFAENNFYDYNLDAQGSAKVTVNGNMTAGNQVLIERDFGTQHSKLTVNFDDRLSTGQLVLPGLPAQSLTLSGYTILSWREIAID